MSQPRKLTDQQIAEIAMWAQMCKRGNRYVIPVKLKAREYGVHRVTLMRNLKRAGA